MNKIFSIFVFTVFFISTTFAQITSSNFVYFDYDKYFLTQASKQTLQTVANKINTEPIYKVKIIGHTDSDGNQKYNEQLSKNRALAVFAFLTKQGIAKEYFTLNYFDEQKPVANNINENGKQLNRRVEILYFYNEPNKVEKEVLALPEIENLIVKAPNKKQQKLKRLKPAAPEIIIANVNELIKIEGKKGTKIEIPNNAFINENGNKVTGKVNIYLEEFYSKSDWILNNLETTCNNKLLESGGMINVVVKQNNKNLKLAKGKEIKIEFNSEQNNQPGFQIFNGEESENEVAWKVQNESESKINLKSNKISKKKLGFTALDTIAVLNKILANYNVSLRNKIKDSNLWNNRDIDSLTQVATLKSYKGLAKLADDLGFANNLGLRRNHSMSRFLNENSKIMLNSKNDSGDNFFFNPNKKTTDVDNTIFASTKLGWVNCDKFKKYNDKATIFVKVEATEKAKTKVRLVFKNINAMVAGLEVKPGLFEFKNVPANKNVNVIAYQKNNNVLSFDLQNSKVEKSNESQIVKLSLKETSYQQFEKAIAVLN